MAPPFSPGPKTRWTLQTDKATFDKLKHEERFWLVVALSRFVNELRFVQAPLEPFEQDTSPVALRVRYNSFLFTCALVYEASLFVNKLGKYYIGMPEYRAMVDVTNAYAAQNLLNSSLSPLRNKLVFHFDEGEIGAQLAMVERDVPTFLVAMG